jgi:hypothetical protein
MSKINMYGFCLDNTDPVLAAFFGLIISGIFLLYKLEFFRILKKIKLKDEKGILLPSALFLLSPFLVPIFLKFLSGLNRESSLGLAIFTSASAIFGANILVENFKKNQTEKKTAKILLNTIEEHWMILGRIQTKLDSIERNAIDQLKDIEIEVDILNSDDIFKKALSEVVLFETDIIDTITEYYRGLNIILNSKKAFLESQIQSKETIDNLLIKTRICKINATLCLAIISKKIFYRQEDFNRFIKLLKGEYALLRPIWNKNNINFKELAFEKKVIQIERLFQEFGISNQLEPLILGYPKEKYEINKHFIAYY